MTYSFHADHAAPDPKVTRWLHVLFYLAALLLLLAGSYSLYLYFTHWSAGEDDEEWWHLVLGLIYLIISGLIAYATYRHGGPDAVDEAAPPRYVAIENGRMVYELNQLEGRQEVQLSEVERVERPSVRDLILHLRSGQRRVLPIYLIDDEAKQQELEQLLARR